MSVAMQLVAIATKLEPQPVAVVVVITFSLLVEIVIVITGKLKKIKIATQIVIATQLDCNLWLQFKFRVVIATNSCNRNTISLEVSEIANPWCD